jgi:hypothetical protein
MTTHICSRPLFVRTPCRHAARKAKPQRSVIPAVERLEDRITPAVPTITGVFLGSTPLPNGDVLTITPTALRVVFSEPMSTTDNNKSLTNVNNYELLDAMGKPVALLSSGAGAPTVSAGPTGPNEAVTLTLANTNLPAGAYTLYVRADQLFDADENQPIAQPGQLVVANSGSGNVSTFAMPGNGSLGAASKYPGPAVAGTQSSPTAVAVASLDNSGANDLIVANAGTDEVAIFAGQRGGGYSNLPTQVLSLPSGSLPSGIVVQDFNNDGLPDIVVADSGTNQITEFVNQSTGPGVFTFGAAQNVTLSNGTTPVGIVAANFSGNANFPDLAVAQAGADSGNKYDVIILTNSDSAAGGFNATQTTVAVGNTAPINLTVPTGLAVGNLYNHALPDIVVSGTGGISELKNTTVGGTVSFTATFVALPTATTVTTSIATGQFRSNITGGNKATDVMATAGSAGTSQLLPFLNDGTGNLTATAPIHITATGAPAALTLQALTGGSLNTLYLDNTASGTLNVLPAMQAGFISAVTNAGGASGTITITSAKHGLVAGQQVIIQNVGADTNANNTFYITNVTTNTFDLVGSNGNAVYTSGGTWVAVPGVITNVTGTGGLPYVITSPNHGLVTGQQVTINGVSGSGGFSIPNGTYVVTRIDANTFSLNGTSAFGTYTANTGTFKLLPYLVDANPVALALGDTNGDGIPDVVVADKTSHDVFVLPGATSDSIHPNGAFQQSSNLSLAPSSAPDAVAVGDLNGDGIPDLVVANAGSNSISVFLGKGGGRYATPQTFLNRVGSVNHNPVSVAIGDLTGDGKPDIVTANSDGTVTIFRNNIPTGSSTLIPSSFSPSVMTVGDSPTQVVLADFNHDGSLDIAVAHTGGGGGVTLLLNKGSGNGFLAGQEIAAGIQATALAAGNFTNNPGEADLAVADATGKVTFFYPVAGDPGKFTAKYTANVGPNPTALATADFNRDGYLDVVAVSGSSSTNQNISVLLNIAGGGFAPAINTTLQTGFPIASVAVADLNQDGFPDLVLGSQSGGFNNIYTMTGNGDGTFSSPNQYDVDSTGNVPPSYVAVANEPFQALTSFIIVDATVKQNLIVNGNFGTADLSGERGNLDGWTVYNEAGSAGTWAPQTGTQSPLSQVAVPETTLGHYQAMLDEPNLMPFPAGSANPNTAASYAGTHVLYQDITLPSLPAVNGSEKLSLTLYIDNSGSSTGDYSDATANPSLDWQTLLPNQQVRIDIMDPSAPALAVNKDAPGSPGVIQNLFTTAPGRPHVQTITLSNVDLTGLVTSNGNNPRTVRLRVASANNRGKLLVGIDNVRVDAVFLDATTPTLTGLALENPSFVAGPGNLPQSSSPVLVGQVGDVGSVKSIAYVQFDFQTPSGKISNVTQDAANGNAMEITSPGHNLRTGQQVTIAGVTGTVAASTNGTFFITVVDADHFDLNGTTFPAGGSYTSGGTWTAVTPTSFRYNTFDANGHFSFTPPFGLIPFQQTVKVTVVDNAGNSTYQVLNFNVQGLSQNDWQAAGPGPIDVSNQGVNYPTISGDVTSLVLDPRDPSGNTIYLGSDNGGVWKTIDGGNDWTALTDNVVDSTGQRVSESIGALGVGLNTMTSAITLYAATGVANDNLTSPGGSGVLVSTDGGATWTVTGEGVLSGAHVSKLAVDPTDPNTAYVAVAYFDDPSKQPGVFKTSNGGQTWVSVLTPANMVTSTGIMGLPAGTALASVTDLVIDPFNPSYVLIGLGNIGAVPASSSAGLWKSFDGGGTWHQYLGNATPGLPNDALPSGTAVGRVTLAIATGKASNEDIYYVMIGTVPGAATPGQVNLGQFAGLYKSKNAGLDWTKVMLRQDTGTVGAENFQNINLLGNEAGAVGALVVDPNDPNVVYVGGSSRFAPAGPLQHAVLRIDTGNMRDTTYVDPNTNTIPNDGDDITKAAAAEAAAGKYPGGAAYTGEGVSWYDLEQAAADNPGSQQLLPNAVSAIVIDGQGRMLFGTVNGIWRGVGRGFGYDFSSGGTGILGGAPAPVPGMTFTDLNGNLQITDVTGVALDPNNPGMLFTSQANGGAAFSSSGPNGWESMGLDFMPGSIAIPSTGHVAAGSRTPGGGPNQPTQLYLGWQDLDPAALLPQFSADAGATFSSLAGTGFNTSDPAGTFSAFALNPTEVVSGGQSFDQLLLGTNRVYVSNTSGSSWSALSGVLSPTGVVSALAFAPSAQGVYYAGTTDGKFFLLTSAGVTDHSAGLPGTRVNAIAVDPSNPALVYALVGGAGNNAFVSSNGGQTWTSIVGAIPGTTLPGVQAYSLAIDPRPLAGAPNHSLYVGTQVGVYVSTDGGQTWSPLGQGLPAAPVVDLQFNPTLNELVAAVRGRGVFELSPRPFAAVEGEAVAGAVLFHFSDPGASAADFTATVSWGDGAADSSATSSNVSVVASSGGGFNVIGSHTYAEELSAATFSVSVAHQGGFFTGLSTSAFSVADAPLTAGALTPPANPVAGTPITAAVLLHFGDADPNAAAGDYTSTVTWGDGTTQDSGSSPAAVQVVVNPSGGFDVLGSHTYLAAATGLGFKVQVVDHGAPISASGTVSVSGDAVINGVSGDNTLILTRASGGPVGSVTYVLNGGSPVTLSNLTSFTFNGGAGNNTMTVSLANGAPLVSGGAVSFAGGAGVNTLNLDAAGLPVGVTTGDFNAAGQAVKFTSVTATHIDNAGAVNSIARPDTADRDAAFAGLNAPERFVQALYLDDLGRAGTKTELDDWVNGQLNQPGGSQQAVAAAIAGSFEADDHLVQSWYFAFLGRQAQGGEELGWVKLLQSGLSEEQVLRQILGDPGHEFYDRAQTLGFGGTADQNYVLALYQGLLNRRASSSELDNGVAALQTMGLQGLALAMLDSQEFRADQFAGYFATLLHRPADASLANWVASGLDAHGVRVAFESGIEFYSNG